MIVKNSLLAICAGTASFAAQSPNVLFILVDELGYSDVGYYGNNYKYSRV